MNDPKFEKVAKYAVGAALLFRVSKSGGSYGSPIDELRANDAAARGMSGDELYALLLDVANRATEDAAREAEQQRYHIISEVRRLAEISDSLSLHRFIENVEAN
jgi:hypothetical protein